MRCPSCNQRLITDDEPRCAFCQGQQDAEAVRINEWLDGVAAAREALRQARKDQP